MKYICPVTDKCKSYESRGRVCRHKAQHTPDNACRNPCVANNIPPGEHRCIPYDEYKSIRTQPKGINVHEVI